MMLRVGRPEAPRERGATWAYFGAYFGAYFAVWC
jgi:hypothetical protein